MKKLVQKIRAIRGSGATNNDDNTKINSNLASFNEGNVTESNALHPQKLKLDSAKAPKESKVANLFKRIESGRKFAL